jgi:hypothetical protein
MSYDDLRVAVYVQETVEGHWFWGVFVGFTGGPGESEEISRIDVLLVQFDPEDRVLKFEVMKHPRGMTTKKLASKWVGSMKLEQTDR